MVKEGSAKTGLVAVSGIVKEAYTFVYRVENLGFVVAALFGEEHILIQSFVLVHVCDVGRFPEILDCGISNLRISSLHCPVAVPSGNKHVSF